MRLRFKMLFTSAAMTLVLAGCQMDPALIRRLFENLVENALRHAPREGRVELAIEVGEPVAVRVSNTGTPISSALRGRLFDPFVRGDDGARGTCGLGLAFCRRVASAHAGALDVVDHGDWPVTFRLSLPRQSIGAEHEG